MGGDVVWREAGRRAGGRLLGSSLEVGLQVTGAEMLSHLSGVRSPLQEGMGSVHCIRVSAYASPNTHPAVTMALGCPRTSHGEGLLGKKGDTEKTLLWESCHII